MTPSEDFQGYIQRLKRECEGRQAVGQFYDNEDANTLVLREIHKYHVTTLLCQQCVDANTLTNTRDWPLAKIQLIVSVAID